MSNKLNTQGIAISAILCSIAIIIPMFSPIKIVLEPASFTLASHVPIFLAMFISPQTAIFVTIGSTIGFLFGGFPLPIVLRALSHLLFVVIGSLYIKKNSNIIYEKKKSLAYSFVMSVVHAIGEVMIIMPFYFGSSLSQGYYDKGFMISVIGLVGIGTIIHSMVDFSLAKYIWNLVPKSVVQKNIIKA